MQLLRLFLSPTFDNSYVGLFLFRERFSLDRKEDRLWKEMGLACKCILAQEVLKCMHRLLFFNDVRFSVMLFEDASCVLTAVAVLFRWPITC